MHEDVESLDAQVNLAPDEEIERSEVGNWILMFLFTNLSSGTNYYFLSRGRGVEDLEDHMIFRGTEESGYMRILQSLDWGGGYFYRATTKILWPPPPPLPRQ